MAWPFEIHVRNTRPATASSFFNNSGSRLPGGNQRGVERAIRADRAWLVLRGNRGQGAQPGFSLLGVRVQHADNVLDGDRS